MSRDEEAIAKVRCRKCKQPKGQGCVYVEPKILPLYANSPRTKALLARVGQPCKRQHNERVNDLWKLEMRERQAAYAEKLAEAKPVHEARMAYGAAVRLETEQLVAWLKQYGRILL